MCIAERCDKPLRNKKGKQCSDQNENQNAKYQLNVFAREQVARNKKVNDSIAQEHMSWHEDDCFDISVLYLVAIIPETAVNNDKEENTHHPEQEVTPKTIIEAVRKYQV